jgi:hypothetical protein
MASLPARRPATPTRKVPTAIGIPLSPSTYAYHGGVSISSLPKSSPSLVVGGEYERHTENAAEFSYPADNRGSFIAECESGRDALRDAVDG